MTAAGNRRDTVETEAKKGNENNGKKQRPVSTILGHSTTRRAGGVK